MLRYLIVGFLITAVLIGGQLYLNESASEQTSQPAATTSAVTPTAITPASQTTVTPGAKPDADPFLASNATIEGPDSGSDEPSEFELNEPASSPWQTDESQPVTPPRYVNRGIDARPLTMKKRDIARLSIGDTVKLPVPQTAQDYEMTVQEVGRHRNGDKSLKGNLVANPSYTVVMTEGRSSTFATINTPDGSFLLEASGNQGWMLSMTDLDAMIDPNLQDYQIPNINRDNLAP